MSRATTPCRPAKAGLLEQLDFSVIDKSKLDPRFVTDYSVGSFYYSFVIGCNKDAVRGVPEDLGRPFRR